MNGGEQLEEKGFEEMNKISRVVICLSEASIYPQHGVAIRDSRIRNRYLVARSRD